MIDFLNHVREQNEEQKKYIDVPLNKIKEWGHIPVETKLYQSILDYRPISINTIISKNFKQSTCRVSFKLSTPYPLVIEITDEEDNLQIQAYYNQNLLKKTIYKLY